MGRSKARNVSGIKRAQTQKGRTRPGKARVVPNTIKQIEGNLRRMSK